MIQAILTDGVWHATVLPFTTTFTNLWCSSTTSCVATGWPSDDSKTANVGVLTGTSWSVSQPAEGSPSPSLLACSAALACVMGLGNANDWWVSQPAPNSAPAFTSANTGTISGSGSIAIQTTGWPDPTITETGKLPAGITFTDNHDGSASLSGTSSTRGVYRITL
jgi:hypothetical protein